MAITMDQLEIDSLLASIEDADLEEVDNANIPTIPLRKVIIVPYQETPLKVTWKRDACKEWIYLIVTTNYGINYSIKVPYAHKYAYSHYDITKVSTWSVVTFYLSDKWVKRHLDVFTQPTIPYTTE